MGFGGRLARYKFSLRPLKITHKSSILTFARANGHICQIWEMSCKCDAVVSRGRVADVLVGQLSARHWSLPCLSDSRLMKNSLYFGVNPSVIRLGMLWLRSQGGRWISAPLAMHVASSSWAGDGGGVPLSNCSIQQGCRLPRIQKGQ